MTKSVVYHGTPEKTRFTTSLFYGRVVITHYDRNRTEEIGRVCRDALIAAGIMPKVKDSFRIEWVDYEDGVEAIDAKFDVETGKWNRP